MNGQRAKQGDSLFADQRACRRCGRYSPRGCPELGEATCAWVRSQAKQGDSLLANRYKVVFTPVGWQVVDSQEARDPVGEFGTGTEEYRRAHKFASDLNPPKDERACGHRFLLTARCSECRQHSNKLLIRRFRESDRRV